MSPTPAILQRLADGEILVADGAAGTLLLARGLEPGRCPESWNLERPEIVEEIARLYRAAGARILQTNTFGGSPAKLSMYGMTDRTEEVNRAGVLVARRAAEADTSAHPEGPALVAGSCGPTGRLLRPWGDADADEIRDGFARQVRALAAAGADLICIETMTDLEEAKLAVEAAKSAGPGLPVFASMTFEATPAGFRTIMGNDVATTVRGLAEAGADGIGSNCGLGIATLTEVVREMRSHTSLPILARPNAGLPEVEGDRTRYPESPAFFAQRAPALVAAGASVVGGCCGTTPDHVRALAESIASRS